MIHAKFAEEARVSKNGSLELRKFGSMQNVTTSLSEGITPAENSAPAISSVTLTPLWYGAWVSYTDQLDLEAFDPVISETSAILGEQAGWSMDTILRDNMHAGATIRYSGTAAQNSDIDTTNDKIDFGDFIGAVAALKMQNAMPADGQLTPVILHAYAWAELMQDSTLAAMFQQSDPEALRRGQLGTVLDCAIYVSGNSKTWADVGNSSCDVHGALFIGKESYGIAGISGLEANLLQDPGGEWGTNTGRSVSPVSVIVKGLGESGLDPLNQRGTIGWKLTYDDAILNSSWLISLHHTTAFSA